MKQRGKSHRPSLSPPVISKIARLCFNGFLDPEIAVMTNLPEAYIKALRLGTYDSRVKKLSLELKDRALERIKSGKGRLGGLIWFCERRFPREWSKPETQLSLSTGTTINQQIIVSADVAENLLKRSKATLTEIDALIQDKQPEATMQ